MTRPEADSESDRQSGHGSDTQGNAPMRNESQRNESQRNGSRASRLTVLVIVALGIAISLFARWYVSSGSGPESLASLDCATLQPTLGELQGVRVEIDRDDVCIALRELATAIPIADGFDERVDDPWHYIGRARVQPEQEAWFLVFVARRSTGFRPELSLRHRRGAGWAIVGQYDGVAVLERLGWLERIDSAKLASPGAREVRDQRQAL